MHTSSFFSCLHFLRSKTSARMAMKGLITSSIWLSIQILLHSMNYITKFVTQTHVAAKQYPHHMFAVVCSFHLAFHWRCVNTSLQIQPLRFCFGQLSSSLPTVMANPAPRNNELEIPKPKIFKRYGIGELVILYPTDTHPATTVAYRSS